MGCLEIGKDKNIFPIKKIQNKIFKIFHQNKYFSENLFDLVLFSSLVNGNQGYTMYR